MNQDLDKRTIVFLWIMIGVLVALGLGITNYLLGKYATPPPIALVPTPMLVPGANNFFKTAVLAGRGGIPPVKKITSMRAEKHLKTLQSDQLPSFIMPPPYHAKVRAYFEGCFLDTSPNFQLEEVASLLITCEDDSMSRILIYEQDKKVPDWIFFSVKGTRCKTKADDISDTVYPFDGLLEVIERAHEEASANQSSP